ncbi:MAG: CopG family transcriptional regulator [Desulfobulbaceae bacterium]|nr:CopG family transcriptional regulator [Desulfobulbaceae bacterium]
MKNVTITLQEEVAKWTRVWAAKHDTSVSKLVGEVLRQRMLEEQGYRSAMRQFLSTTPQPLKKKGQYPTREDIHER